ncbi:dynamin family protein [Corynebacterium epidermidicanis]|uniref:50S ribosome-binding GTPase n=1 Tax=Corynebacterium epidermidicanis TaxID=1050174 RepID=A0A0G3GRP1_9CORY|nr:dynamin family protein [Corynebacterium epidermidicanis]AKK03861.1 50S ribosome-binding GTPase [Corynebacterium epidermidicanis]
MTTPPTTYNNIDTSRDQSIGALTTLLTQATDALAQGGPELAEHAVQLREMVSRPPRVAVVGRLKSGKSTLVNALTQHEIAATGSLECTMAVSMYFNGAPARAEIHSRSGEVKRIPLSEGPLEELGFPLEDVDHIEQFLPNAQLQRLTLIDTPGTATLTVENEERTRRVLVDGQQDTKRASSWADSLVFLSDSAPREDERLFLSQLGMTPLTSVGVLSRADSFGAGAFGQRDPLDYAATHAENIAAQLGNSVLEVVPLSGFLAESALVGRVNGTIARTLGHLASLNREQLLDVIEVEDPSVIVPGLSAHMRDELLDTVGEYGIVAARDIAAAEGAVGLVNWMIERSGISRLTQLLTGEMSYFAVLQRAVRMLDVLDQLAGANINTEHVRWVQSVTLSQPGMHFVLLYRSYRNTYAATPDSRLLAPLRAAIEATSAAEVVGLSRTASPNQVRAELEQRLGEMQQLAMGLLSAAEDEARERLVVAYQAALRSLG